jgi:hypothetical protein
MDLRPFSSIILAAIFCIQIFQLTVYGVDASTEVSNMSLNDTLFFVYITFLRAKTSSEFQLYIVYLGEKRHDDPTMVTASHYEMLTPLFGRF